MSSEVVVSWDGRKFKCDPVGQMDSILICWGNRLIKNCKMLIQHKYPGGILHILLFFLACVTRAAAKIFKKASTDQTFLRN